MTLTMGDISYAWLWLCMDGLGMAGPRHGYTRHTNAFRGCARRNRAKYGRLSHSRVNHERARHGGARNGMTELDVT